MHLRSCFGRVAALVTLCAAVVFTAASARAAVTISSPIQAGDSFFVDTSLTNLSQIRNGARVGTQVSYGATDRLGGIAADSAGSLYLAGNPGDAGITVEQITLGHST